MKRRLSPHKQKHPNAYASTAYNMRVQTTKSIPLLVLFCVSASCLCTYGISVFCRQTANRTHSIRTHRDWLAFVLLVRKCACREFPKGRLGDANDDAAAAATARKTASRDRQTGTAAAAAHATAARAAATAADKRTPYIYTYTSTLNCFRDGNMCKPWHQQQQQSSVPHTHALRKTPVPWSKRAYLQFAERYTESERLTASQQYYTICNTGMSQCRIRMLISLVHSTALSCCCHKSDVHIV